MLHGSTAPKSEEASRTANVALAVTDWPIPADCRAWCAIVPDHQSLVARKCDARQPRTFAPHRLIDDARSRDGRGLTWLASFGPEHTASAYAGVLAAADRSLVCRSRPSETPPELDSSSIPAQSIARQLANLRLYSLPTCGDERLEAKTTRKASNGRPVALDTPKWRAPNSISRTCSTDHSVVQSRRNGER
jgi:hypothetical protein